MLAALPGCAGGQKGQASPEVVSALGEALAPDDRLRSFYEARQSRPLWIRGGALREDAEALLARLRAAGSHGLGPEAYDIEGLTDAVAQARSGDPDALAAAELGLSRALAAYVHDLHRPPAEAAMVYTHRSVAPPRFAPADILTDAAAAPSIAAYLDAAEEMHPVYEGLRQALMSAPTAEQPLIRANMARARALPPGRGKHILVDTASARLWMFEDGRAVDSMRVIVGARQLPTPTMAGLIGFAVLNPYWNLPPDLIRERAWRAVAYGPDAIRRERLQLLSGWSKDAHPIAPESVDWLAVAEGRRRVRVRQLPGGDNLMGRIKFMLPNRLGIYLHDTPDKTAFAREDRRMSSGCVRVEDSERLARWLFDGAAPKASGAPEQRVNLPRPVPVYIIYMTAMPESGGVSFARDDYRRDEALLASFEAPEPRLARTAASR